jgi:hypothetical protein
MSAAKLKLTIEQGTTFTRVLTFKTALGVAINLTGNTIAGQIRYTYADTSPAASFVVNLADAANGNITISLSDTSTSALTPGGAVYDIERTKPDGTKSRILEGTVVIKPEVTR